MPATAPQALPKVVHELFCLPRSAEESVRVEQFVAYRDNEAGRSVPAVTVTRCMECGASTYQPIGA